MLSFCAVNNCYFVPMSLSTTKKPCYGYKWANRPLEEHLKLLQSKEKERDFIKAKEAVRDYRASKYTENLNHYFQKLIRLKKEHKQPSGRLLQFRKYIITSFDALALQVGKSNLIVFDCDVKNHNDIVNFNNSCNDCNGLDVLIDWCKKENLNFNDFLNTATSRTPSGGYHFFFKYDKTDIKKVISFLPHVDLISGNNLTIAPFSAKNINGITKHYEHGILSITDGLYSFSTSKINKIHPLPSSVRDVILKIQKPKKIAPTNVFTPVLKASDRQKNRALKILQRHLNDFRNASEGQRHDQLLHHVRCVFMFYQYLTDYTHDDIITMFKDIAIDLGLTVSEIRQPILDAMNFGLSHQKSF